MITCGLCKPGENSGEKGNVFFALFGAVAVVGMIGAASMSVMRGPVSTMVQVNKRTQAESQMQIAANMAVIESIESPTNGNGEDCDSDGNIEPIPPRSGSSTPTGGGLLPATFGVAKTDPWGTEYGYCVWDSGTSTGDANCNEGAGEEPLLDGEGNGDNDYTVIAIISAGADRAFQTTCRTFTTADANSDGNISGSEKLAAKTSGSDDIIIETTYGVAQASVGGLWTIKTGDSTTATTTKKVEVTQDASFGGALDLQTLGGSFLLPDHVSAGACNAANEGTLMRDTNDDPPTVKICDYDSGAGAGWVSVAAGSTTLTRIIDGDTIVEVVDATPAITFDVDGTEEMVINATTLNAGSLNVTTTGTLAVGNTTITGTLGAGATTVTTLTATGNVVLGDAATDTTTITGPLTASETVTISNTAGADPALDVTGNVDIGGGYLTLDNTQSLAWGDSTVAITGSSAADTLDIAANVVTLDGSVNITNGGTADPALDVTGDIEAVNLDLSGDLSVSGNDITMGSNTSGSILIADGTNFSPAAVSGDIALASNGSVTIQNDAVQFDDLDVSGVMSNELCLKADGTTGMKWQTCSSGAGGGDGVGSDGIEEVLTNDSDANGQGLEGLGVTVIGATSATGDLSLDVEGKVGATQYCLNDNTACFTTGQMNQDIAEVLGVGANAGNSIDLVNLSGLAMGSTTISDGSNANLLIDVTGDVGAIEYCDENGANCFTPASVASLVGGSVSGIDDLDDAMHDITTDFDGDADATNDDNLFIGHEGATLTAQHTATPGSAGARNTAIGATALDAVTTGDANVAIGYAAATTLILGKNNVALGVEALRNHNHDNSVAIGYRALYQSSSTTRENTAVGSQALQNLTNNHVGNTAIGYRAGRLITNSSGGTFVGANSGSSSTALIEHTTIVGHGSGSALDGGDNNLFLGYDTGDTTTTGSNNIIIGYDIDASSATVSHEINIGDVLFGNIDDSSTAGVDETQFGVGMANAAAINASALVEFASTTRGFLPPRMTTVQRDAINSGTFATGLTVYDTTTNELQYYNGTSWVSLTGGNGGSGLELIDGTSNDDDTWVRVAADDGSDNDTIRFAAGGGTEHMRIASAGNVGIGTTSPSSTLHVDGDVRADDSLILGLTAGDAPTYITQSNFDWDDLVNAMTLDATTTIDMTAGDLNFDSDTFVIDSSTDRVGIGTDNPSSLLHINGTPGNLDQGLTFGDGDSGFYEGPDDNIRVALEGSDRWFFNTSSLYTLTGPAPMIQASGSSLVTFVPRRGDSDTGMGRSAGSPNDFLGFYTANTERLTMDSSGGVGIATLGSPNDLSAIFQVDSTTRGFLPPRMTAAQRDAINGGTFATGLTVYNTDTNTLQYYDGTAWQNASASGGLNINDLSDAFHDTATDFDGDTTDNDDNLAIGHTFATLDATNPGARNTAIGAMALDAVTTGDENIAIGYDALSSNTVRGNNVAIGVHAMADGSGNGGVAIGQSALRNGGGDTNIAIGMEALLKTTSGFQNVAIGTGALRYQGGSNFRSVAIGHSSGQGTNGSSSDSANNVFVGYRTGFLVEDGDNNIFVGYQAGDITTTGSNNLVIGYDIDPSSATASNELNIGGTIYGDLSTDSIGIGAMPAAGVELDVTGDIQYTGTITDVSDRRLKTDIHELSTEAMLDRLAKIKTYEFKMKDDSEGRVEFGVMAQDLERIFPELVHTADDAMHTKSVNYMGLIAPMIEVTKALKAENDTLKMQVASIEQKTEMMGASLTSLSAQVDTLNKSSLRTVQEASFAPWMLMMFGFICGGALCVVVSRAIKQ